MMPIVASTDPWKIVKPVFDRFDITTFIDETGTLLEAGLIRLFTVVSNTISYYPWSSWGFFMVVTYIAEFQMNHHVLKNVNLLTSGGHNSNLHWNVVYFFNTCVNLTSVAA